MISEEITIPFYHSSLSARFFYPNDEHGRFPVVCKVHGLITTNFEKEEELASMLTSEGVAYFVFHFTGFNTSPGVTSIQKFLSNLDHVVSFLTNHSKIDPLKIGLYGISLGGAIATCHASRDHRIAALALQAPLYDFSFMVNYPEFDALWKGLEYAGLIRLPKEGIKEQLIEDIQGNNPLTCIKEISPRPLIIIAGGKDAFIPLEGIKKLYRKAENPKRFVMIPNADHNLTNYFAKYEVFNQIKNFFINYFQKKHLDYQKIVGEISVF
ncbi:MAG: alpha/beta hydrolase [Candidatus Heimdallarchaeota archaeon]|nr:alpha/beta hydrolase [Candidatus Heimdallarchaeota archaeon]